MEVVMSRIEYIWRASCQIALNEQNDKEPLEPMWWGSGFFLLHKDKLYFVTADHCIHPDDYAPVGDGRNGKEYIRHILTNTNVKGELSSYIQALYDFYFFDRRDEDFPDIVDKLDVAITKVESSILNNLVTTNWIDPKSGKDIVSAGLVRVPVDSRSATKPKAEDKYIVVGCIHNSSDGVKAHRESIGYCDLHFVEMSDGEIVISTPLMGTTHKDWESLSGSPVFSYNGEILGMLTREVSEEQRLRVIPIERIIKCVEEAEKEYSKDPYEIRNS